MSTMRIKWSLFALMSLHVTIQLRIVMNGNTIVPFVLIDGVANGGAILQNASHLCKNGTHLLNLLILLFTLKYKE